MRWFLFPLLFVTSIWAHQSSTTSSGKPLYWADKNVPIQINPQTADLSSSIVRTIISDSMNEWNSASSASARAVSSSKNQIRFTDNFSIYGSAVIGLTEISYNSSGVIQKASILLNDNYKFTSTPNSFADGSVYLGDVVTHEMGHLFGLSHSEVLNSSMFYSSFPGQSSLSLDDKSAIRQKYDFSGGTISGRVLGGDGIGVLGVHVQLVSRKSAEVIGAVSNQDGHFSISGLDLNNSYYLYTSPIKDKSSLPNYYSNVQTDFCPASYVGSFFSACGSEFDGFPQAITLNEQKPSINVGAVTINCSLRANDDYSYQKIQSTFAPVTIWESFEEDVHEKSFVGFFNPSSDWSQWERLKADLSGVPVTSFSPRYLKLNFLAHPFGNLMEYQMRVFQNGNEIAHEMMQESSLLGTFNNDMNVTQPLSSIASENVFEIEIRARTLNDAQIFLTYPSWVQYGSDSHMPYLLMLGIQEGASKASALPMFNSVQRVSDNESCLDAPFTYAVTKSDELDSKTIDRSTASSEFGSASCASTEPPDEGPHSSLMLLSIGFFLSLMLGQITKKTKNFLS